MTYDRFNLSFETCFCRSLGAPLYAETNTAGNKGAKTATYRRLVSESKGTPALRVVVRAVPCWRYWLNAQHTAKTAGGVVRLGTVVINEHLAVATVAEERAAEGTHLVWCGHPAGRLEVELTKLLQLAVLLLGQQLFRLMLA